MKMILVGSRAEIGEEIGKKRRRKGTRKPAREAERKGKKHTAAKKREKTKHRENRGGRTVWTGGRAGKKDRGRTAWTGGRGQNNKRAEGGDRGVWHAWSI
jgi:hypothetical protein